MKKDFNNLKIWLEELLTRYKLSVEDLSKEADISRTSLYHYMNDKMRPTEQTMVRICHVFNVPLEEGLSQYTPKKAGRPTTPAKRMV
jgi:transcriptional regulator with XRE-family HTH domain